MRILQHFTFFLISALLLSSSCLASDIHGVLVNKEACRGGPAHFNITGGTITSPLHPRGPLSQVSCTWVLHNPFEDTLILSFNVFDLDQDTKCGKRLYECCPHQWLMIKTEPRPSRARRDVHGKNRKGNTESHRSLYGNTDKKRNLQEPHRPEPINLKKEWFDLPLFHSPLFNGSLGDFLMSRSLPKPQNYTGSNRQDTYVISVPEVQSSENGKTTGRICGKSPPLPIVTKDPRVTIKFYSDTMVEPGHLGFSLQFQISNNLTVCNAEEFMCSDPQLCIPKSWQCNGQVECPDSSDEADCQAGCAGLADSEHCDGRWHCENGEDELGCFGCDADEWWCGEGTECYKATRRCDGIPDCNNRADEVYCNCFNQTRCGPNSEFCYDPKTQRCDGVLHCPNGNDEMDCGGHCRHMIPCSHGGVCYTSAQRCDGTPQCGDGSDEASCTPQLCHPQHGAFLCANHRCIRDTWRCDQYDDCGDASDEEDCLRNSVIVAAAMGGLVCSLLLVIAVGCSCRLYALRVGLNRQSQQSHRGGRRSTPLSPLSRLEQHLLQREPPPSYSVAVNDPSAALFGSRRISRQWRRQRRRPPAPPEGILPPLPVPMRGRVAPGPPHRYDTGPGHASNMCGFTGDNSVGRNSRNSDEKENEEGAKAVTPNPVPPTSTHQVQNPSADTVDDDVPLLSAVDDGDERDDAPLLEVTSTSEDSGDDGGNEEDDAVLLDVSLGLEASDTEESELEGGSDDSEARVCGGVEALEDSIDRERPTLSNDPISSGSTSTHDLPYSDSPDTASLPGDVITDTRAAVMALSVVQRHTDDVQQADTELTSQ